jgi:hypothetical protein
LAAAVKVKKNSVPSKILQKYLLSIAHLIYSVTLTDFLEVQFHLSTTFGILNWSVAL